MDPGKNSNETFLTANREHFRELSMKPAIARSHYTLKSNQSTVTMMRPKLLKPIKNLYI